jgi:transcription antitermination factor NusG
MGNSNNIKNNKNIQSIQKTKRIAERAQSEQKFIELCKNELIGYTIVEAYTYILNDDAYHRIREIRKVNNVMVTHDYDYGRLNVSTDENDKIIEIIDIG